MIFSRPLIQPLLHIFFPHHCMTCGTDQLPNDQLICAKCYYNLPKTNFANMPGNPVEQSFYGRVKIRSAYSEFYFAKGKLVQELMQQLKYNGKKEVGIFLGKKMGKSIQESPRFDGIDLIVPLPLNKKKEFQRGYNQSLLICQGISEILQIPISKDNLIRERYTETQTKKHRAERWENVDGSFKVLYPEKFENKQLLLVDDVKTTGATLEAAAMELLKIPGVRIDIATAAVASQ